MMQELPNIIGARTHYDIIGCYVVLLLESSDGYRQEITITLDKVKVDTFKGNETNRAETKISCKEFGYDYSKGLDSDSEFTPLMKWVTRGLHGIPLELRKPLTMTEVIYER